MNFEYRIFDGVSVFKLHERKLDTNNSGLLKGEFTSIIKNGRITRFVVDLTDVEHCDSSGLSALLVANNLIQGNDGHIRVVASEKIMNLVSVTRLDQVLQLASTTQDAVGELSGL